MRIYSAKILIFFLAVKITLAQIGWVPLNSGTNLILNDIQFLNESTGYFCAGHILNSTGLVRKTSDGGASWTTILSLSAQLNEIYFIDANTGTVVGESNTIQRTTNGGATWITQFPPVGGQGRYLCINFLDANVGMIGGGLNSNADGIILYTSNAGANWLNRSYGHDAGYFGIRIFDVNTSIVVAGSGGPSGTIIKTTNSGFNWIIQSTAGGFSSISFMDNNNGIVTQAYGISKTTNGGSNWIYQQLGSNFFFLWDNQFIDNLNIFTVGDSGKVFRSTNTGSNWIMQSSGTTKRLRGVFFVNPNTGWACGDTGTLIKTTDGGITAIQPISNIIPKSFSLEQNYPNPFNPNTKIKFQIPLSREISTGQGVLLSIYNALGREIAVLVNEELSPGTYEINWDASAYSSGMYFYSLEAIGFKDTKKMVLIK